MKPKNLIQKIDMKAKNIHNLDSLEKEIYRLQLAAKLIEEKLDHNFDHLHENFSSMAMNSFFCSKKNKSSEKDNLFSEVLNNEKLNSVLSKVTDRMAERAADGVTKLVDKIFSRKKHTSE